MDTVKGLIEELLCYNMDAKISVVAHCQKEDFTVTFRGDEGVTKQNCDSVSLYVDRLCTNEKTSNGTSSGLLGNVKQCTSCNADNCKHNERCIDCNIKFN